MIKGFGDKTPQVTESAFVSEAAYIIGDVEIGENSSVWPGTVIRGDFAKIAIGKNTQIEDNCVVHTGTPMTIGDNVHIGHSVVVHCHRIGNNVLIGNNATLLDNAEVGDFCIISANTLVGQGMNIPDMSFVAGVPAEIKGEVTAEQIARIKTGILAYVNLAQEYKKQGL